MKSGKQRKLELRERKSVRQSKADARQEEETRARREQDAAQGGCLNPDFVGIPRRPPEVYADYVEHPRFGKSPHYTGFDPNPNTPEVWLHSNTGYTPKWLRRHDARTVEETLEMADCCLTLVEEAIFHPRPREHVRILLKHIPEDAQSNQQFRDLTARLEDVADAI
jgi:hypothetical protein